MSTICNIAAVLCFAAAVWISNHSPGTVFGPAIFAVIGAVMIVLARKARR